MEFDSEIKGDGNTLNTDFRQYDNRLGRWFSPDRLKHMYPSTSQYCYALNTPIGAKDDNGMYTIFVNGFIYGSPLTTSDNIKPGYTYWRGNKWTGDPGQFIKAAHDYFGDGKHEYINGTGLDFTSEAWDRQYLGRKQGKITALEILQKIKDGEQIDEINFVTHSMGAAFAEGMIEEMMKYPELAGLLKKGEIVHFAAADGDNIVISENSKDLKRSQLNYKHDKTINEFADMCQEGGGYSIPGIKKIGVVDSHESELHKGKNHDNYDLHFDSKTYKESWDFLEAMNKKYQLNKSMMGKPIHLDVIDLSNIQNEREEKEYNPGLHTSTQKK